jgi:hypothetical protein
LEKAARGVAGELEISFILHGVTPRFLRVFGLENFISTPFSGRFGYNLRDLRVWGQDMAPTEGDSMVYRDDTLVSSADGPIIPSKREPPPKDLTPKQRAIWVEITNDLDRDWFSDTAHLLKELVCHIDYARMLAGGIEAVRGQLVGLPLGSKEERAMSRQLATLLRSHGKQSAAIANLSTKLRLTPQSRQSARRADQVRHRTGSRPWEWQSNE